MPWNAIFVEIGGSGVDVTHSKISSATAMMAVALDGTVA
jgi:hypothetical protein